MALMFTFVSCLHVATS